MSRLRSGCLVLVGLAVSCGVPDAPISRGGDAAVERLVDDCQTAADVLGFAVACPSVWYSQDDVLLECREMCLSISQSSGAPIDVFVIGAEDFDELNGHPIVHVGVRHALVMSRPIGDAPASPCPNAEPAGRVAVGDQLGGREVPVFRCPDDATEGSVDGTEVHRGHTLAVVTTESSYSAVSVHGDDADTSEELQEVLGGMRIVDPSS